MKVEFVQGVSGKSGYGFDRLISQLTVSAGKKVAIIGATNVGKSSIISQFLNASHRGRNHNKSERKTVGPVVSRFAGTTLGNIPIKVRDLSMTIVDTPGLIPDGRVSDMVCSQCRDSLVPGKGLAGKLFDLKPGRTILLGPLAALTNTGAETAVVSVYSSEGVTLHETSSDKAAQILSDIPQWLQPSCGQCQKQLELTDVDVKAKQGEDIAIAGLGWFSIRKNPVSVKVSLPAGARYEKRINLIGLKKWNR